MELYFKVNGALDWFEPNQKPPGPLMIDQYRLYTGLHTLYVDKAFRLQYLSKVCNTCIFNFYAIVTVTVRYFTNPLWHTLT